MFNQTLTILQISDAITETEKEFGETPVELRCGQTLWNTVGRYFSVNAQTGAFALCGVAVTADPSLEEATFLVTLANGKSKLYEFALD